MFFCTSRIGSPKRAIPPKKIAQLPCVFLCVLSQSRGFSLLIQVPGPHVHEPHRPGGLCHGGRVSAHKPRTVCCAPSRSGRRNFRRNNYRPFVLEGRSIIQCTVSRREIDIFQSGGPVTTSNTSHTSQSPRSSLTHAHSCIGPIHKTQPALWLTRQD